MAGRIDQAAQSAAITRIVEVSAAADAIRAELQRLLASPSIAGSQRSQKLLTYVVEKALASQFDLLKERVIGTDVFQRPADYNTGEDAIVRVAATELRRRLADHYAQTEHDSGVKIQLPAGTYIPDFQVRAAVAEPVEIEEPAVARGPREKPGRWPYLVLGALLIALAADDIALRRGTGPKELPAPWSTLFAGDRRVHIVTSDTSHAAMSDLLGQRLSLSDYASYRYPAPPESVETRRALQLLSRNQFTSLADVAVTARIMRLGPAAQRATVRGARSLQLREFLGDDNFVLIGSVRANPWAEIVTKAVGYYIEYDDKLGRQVCRDRRAASGKPAEYIPTTATGGTGESYSVATLVKNPSGTGHILWIAGTSMEGTEAAGNFVTNPEQMAGAVRELAGKEFEILFKLTSMAGAARETQIVDARPISAGR